MNIADVLPQLLTTTHTTAQWQTNMSRLRGMLEGRFFQPETSSDKSQLLFSDTTLPEEFLSSFTKENMYDRLKEIEDLGQSLPRLFLTVALELPEEKVAELGRWARENIAKNLLLDLKQDHSLLAGCVFTWQDREHNYSLRQALTNSQDLIANALHSSLTKEGEGHE